MDGSEPVYKGDVMKDMILNRLQEPSTWRGLTMFATAAGIGLSPDLVEYITAIGMGLAGLIGFITSDKSNG